MIRSHWIIFVTGLLTGVLLSTSSCGSEEDKNTAALERRQKVELLNFFNNPSKNTVLQGTTFSIQLFNEAVEHFKNENYPLARESLKESLKYNDTHAYAYELLGDIDYLEQKNSDAKENYQIAYAFDPSSRVKDKLEKLTKESKVEQKLSTYHEEHFIIKYHASDKNVEGYELKEMLRDAYRMISQDLSYYFKHQVVVLLYDEKDFREITNAPHWAGGIYDGKVRMPMTKKGFQNVELKSLTTHELTHAFIASISQGRAPAWINEGLAVYEEDRIKKNDLTVFNSAIKTNSLLPIDRLMADTNLQSIKDSLEVQLFYEQSFKLVDYLIQRYRMFVIKQMLEAFGQGKSSAEVIQSVLKISPQKMEQEWKMSFTK